MDEKEKSAIAQQWEKDKKISTRILAVGRFEWLAWGKDIPHQQGEADTYDEVYAQIYDAIVPFIV